MLSYKIIFKKAIYCYLFPLSKAKCKKKTLKSFSTLFYFLEFGKGEELNTWLMSVFNSIFFLSDLCRCVLHDSEVQLKSDGCFYGEWQPGSHIEHVQYLETRITFQLFDI